MTKEIKPRKKSQKQLLVEALLGLDPNPQLQRKINWGAEMKVLLGLLKRFPDVDFWFYHAKKHTYHSLLGVLYWARNTSEIHSAYASYTRDNKLDLKPQETPKLSPEKVGEDIIVLQKRKTLSDFLK